MWWSQANHKQGSSLWELSFAPYWRSISNTQLGGGGGGGQKFSKLDLSHAYQQLLLDNESREYLTVNTHRGLFQPTRLQFGVQSHSASGVFQREMEKRLSHIPFTSVRVDDILVSGSSDAEQLSNLKAVLQVIEDCGQ